MRGREGGRAGGAARRGRHARPLSVTAAPGGGAGRAGVCVPACLGRCPRPLPGEGIREAAGVRTVHWTPYNWHTEHPRDESIRWPTRRRAAAVTAAVRRQRARAAQQARAGAPHGLVSQRAVPCTGRPVQSVPAVQCPVLCGVECTVRKCASVQCTRFPLRQCTSVPVRRPLVVRRQVKASSVVQGGAPAANK